MDRIVIIGASGHARVVIDIIEQAGLYEIAGLIDRDLAIGDEMFGCGVIGREADLPELRRRHDLRGMIVAIGDNFIRDQVLARATAACPELPLISAVHPRASIARGVTIGPGSMIMAGAVVNPCSTIGSCCIVNTNSSLDHDSRMDDFSSLAPGAALGGHCRIGAYSAIGIGATVIHGRTLGEHVVVGAGSTVLHDVEPRQVVYGSPARLIRPRQPGDRYL